MSDLHQRIVSYFKSLNKRKNQEFNTQSAGGSGLRAQKKVNRQNTSRKMSLPKTKIQRPALQTKKYTLQDYFPVRLTPAIQPKPSPKPKRADLQQAIKQCKGVSSSEIILQDDSLQLSFLTEIEGKQFKIWISSQQLFKVNPLWLLNYYQQYI